MVDLGLDSGPVYLHGDLFTIFSGSQLMLFKRLKVLRRDSVELPPNKSLAVVMAFTTNYHPFAHDSAQRNRRYALENNYHFELLEKPSSTPHYLRYELVLQMFKQGFDYVCYIDSDAVFTSSAPIKVPKFPCEVLFGNEFPYSYSSGPLGLLNSGYAVYHSSQFSRNFVQSILTDTLCDGCRSKKCPLYYDQDCIDRLFRANPKLLQRVGYTQVQDFPLTSNKAHVIHAAGVKKSILFGPRPWYKNSLKLQVN